MFQIVIIQLWEPQKHQEVKGCWTSALLPLALSPHSPCWESRPPLPLPRSMGSSPQHSGAPFPGMAQPSHTEWAISAPVASGLQDPSSAGVLLFGFLGWDSGHCVSQSLNRCCSLVPGQVLGPRALMLMHISRLPFPSAFPPLSVCVRVSRGILTSRRSLTWAREGSVTGGAFPWWPAYFLREHLNGQTLEGLQAQKAVVLLRENASRSNTSIFSSQIIMRNFP